MLLVAFFYGNMEIDSNLVEEFKDLHKDDTEFIKRCAKLVQEINSGQLTIVYLVEQLGPLLVDASPNNRELGTWVLTRVLKGLRYDHLDVKQLHFICTFYSDRLKDHHQVIPAVLCGILALAKFKQFPTEAATKILAALFQNVSCQQQQQNDRHNIYKIFEIFQRRCTSELCAMGLDYVYGVISAVDGERDPKNLIFLFNWFPNFLRSVDLKHLTEEAFEILACYFPVDFKAPPQDPNAITRDQLADALAPCLTAIPQFSEFCFPLALEKLGSSLEVAKLDSLKLLKSGCLYFDESSYVQHVTEIWSHIQKELFSNPSTELENVCLSTLLAVIKKISGDSKLIGTLKDISDTMKRNLLPDSRLFEPSLKLLLKVAEASEISCSFIVKEIVPILINTFNITTTSTHKVVVLAALVKFFQCYVKLHNTIEFEEINNIPLLCLKAAIDENDTLRSVGFNTLSEISDFLPMDVRLPLYDNLQKLLSIPQNEHVIDSVLACFVKLSTSYPTEVKDKIIDKAEIDDLKLYLDALCVIASLNYFTTHVIDVMFIYLVKDQNFSTIAVSSLEKLLKYHENNENVRLALLEKNTLSLLIDWSINQNENIQDDCLKNVAFILKSLIGYLSSNEQRQIINRELVKILSSLQRTRTFICLLDGLLCRLHRDVEIDYKLLTELTDIASKESHDFVQDVAVQLLANLVNKCSNEDVLRNYLNQLNENQEKNLVIFSWITKALVMRNHESSNHYISKLIDMLRYDKNVATCFRIIINDNCDALSNRSYSNRTLLYQQKFFTIVSNKLIENYHCENGSYLIALGYLLEHTPKQAILIQFKKILKLVILCLDECMESEVLVVLLNIILEFISRKESCIEDHLSEFLQRLLKLSMFDKSMKVRMLALQCLQQYTSSFPLYKLLPYKQEVLKTLGKCIDDKKRLVRREAVEARSLWFILDAPV